MADQFLYHPYKRLFCSGKCSFVPEQTRYQRKIVIVNFPLLEMGRETGRFINCLMKMVFLISWLSHKIQDETPIVFCAADEMQYFLLPREMDNFFAQTSRGSRVAMLGATQNFTQLAAELGENELGSRTLGWLGNWGTKIAFQQNDVRTNSYFSDLIGKHYTYLWSISDNESPSHGITQTEHLMNRLEPDIFSTLEKPNRQRETAECIIHMGGKRFAVTRTTDNPKGLNYLRYRFSR
jgi:hypothetical protein